MTNNIKVNFITDSYKVRDLCIRERWYECGDVREYSALLNFVDLNRILDEGSLDVIAKDIYEHSTNKMNLYTKQEHIDNIKHIILNDATTICLCDE